MSPTEPAPVDPVPGRSPVLPARPADAEPGLARLGRWSWQVVGVALAAVVLVLVADAVRPVLVPVLVGLLLAALLSPVASVLRRALPAYAASALTMVAFLGLVVAASWGSGAQLGDGVRRLVTSLPDLLGEVQARVDDGVLGVTGDQVDQAVEQLRDWLTGNGAQVADQVLSFGSSAASLLTATLLALVTTFFFLADGRRLWSWVLGLLPTTQHARADRAAGRAWEALQAYIRTQAVVAAVDAAGIGLGAWALGLPYVEAIVLIVFLTAFVPIVGAFLSGGLAVLVALGAEGVTEALIMLAVVLVVQQLESNVLQPVLMGKAVDLHPWAVIVGVALGSYLLGVTGAVLAVPAMAVVNVVVRSWGEPLEERPVADAAPKASSAAEVDLGEPEDPGDEPDGGLRPDASGT
jgi:predicted PurR-regulated permease PerM